MVTMCVFYKTKLKLPLIILFLLYQSILSGVMASELN